MSVYLSIQNLIQINLEMIEEWGGLAGTRDPGALEAAAALRPVITLILSKKPPTLRELASKSSFCGWRQTNGDYGYWCFLAAE